MPTKTVYVATGNPALRRGLLAQFEQQRDLFFVPEPSRNGLATHGDILISTPMDCPAERCAQLAESGVRVMILAPVPRDRERQRYRRAGAAAYLPMSVEHGHLLQEVQRVAEASGTPRPLPGWAQEQSLPPP
ncbi:MAG: hypothetical protein HY875_15535 [Chloroflexi bacterium]|nr:hypothetical protein [Chloroflexota bacterium]